MSKFFKRAICALIILIAVCTGFSMYAFAATTVTVLDGAVSITDTATSMSESGGTVTVTAKGGLLSQTTNTITITNNSGVKAKLTFTYSASNYSSFSESSASGSYSADLEAGASVTMSIKGKRAISSNTATLTLSGFSLVPISASSNVTFTYDSTYGSITVGGTATANDAVVNIPSSGVALVATPVSGATFLGWIDAADGSMLSTATSYTLTPATDMTVQAVFIGANSAPWFGVGSGTEKTQSYGFLSRSNFNYHTVASYTHLFDNLNTAATTAVSNGKYVVLLNSGTLPAGDYTIPSGVALLIPFDSANTTYTTAAQFTDTYTKPVEYRTLTMASGAKLVINGSMSISAKQKYAAGGSTYGGMAVGNTGFVRMNSGSSITVNSGGALYSYGYIIGSGTVTAKSGATVYEGFQIMDFRGGSQSTGMKNGVFPLSQYYVQNIEVSLTLEAGAAEYAYTWMNMSSATFGSAVKFIGPTDAMFKISNGSITKYYDAGTDRLMIEVDGDLSISSVSLSFAATVGTEEISSEDFVLGLNGNISVTINGGTTTINQDIAMQPGAHLTIGEKASVVIGAGKRLYVYDSDQWGTYVHYKNTAVTYVRPLIYAPTRNPQTITEEEGRALTNADLTDASILVKGTLDASKGYIYTTASGAQITGSEGGQVITVPGADMITYQLKQQADPVTYDQIPITPAKLINSDATIVETGKGADDAATTYTYTNGSWRCGTHSYGDWSTNREATCGEAGEKQRICSVCNLVEKGTIDATGEHTEVIDAAVAPTCTATGLTAGKHCSVCNEVLVAQTEVAAKGHAEVNHAAKAATCTEKGWHAYVTCSRCDYTTYSEIAALGHTEVIDAAVAATCTSTGLTEGKHCSVCNEVIVAQTEVAAKGHSFTKDTMVCDICGLFKFYANVRLGNNLDMMFAFPQSAGSDCYVQVVRTRADGTTDAPITYALENETYPLGTVTIDGTDYYMITYSGFAAKEMCDTITLTVYDKDGKVISISWTDSIQAYALRMLEKATDVTSPNEELQTVIVDMLNYGTACQDYFGYSKDNLANAKLSDEQKSFTDPAVTKSTPEGDTWNSSNLITDSNIEFALALNGISAEGYVTYSFTGHKGNEEIHTVEYEDMEGIEANTPYILIPELVVADARRLIEVTVCKDGTTTETWYESIEAYVARNATSGDVYYAFMKFADSAYTYLHNK